MRDFLDALDEELHRVALRQEQQAPRRGRLIPRPALWLRRAVAPALVATATVAVVGLVFVLALRGGAVERPAAAALAGEYTSRVVIREGPLPGDAPRRSSLSLAEGTFTVSSGIYGLQGTTEIDGDTVRFRSPSGFYYLPQRANTAGGLPEGSEGCLGATAAGEYRWRVSGGVLALRVVRDPCRPRARLLDGEWAAARGGRSG